MNTIEDHVTTKTEYNRGSIWENKKDPDERAVIHFIKRCGGGRNDYNVTFHINTGDTFTISLQAFDNVYKFVSAQLSPI